MDIKEIINKNAEQILGMGKPVISFKRESIEDEKYTLLHKSSPINSTNFTNCCGCAVTSTQTKCPACGALIHGRQS